MDTSTPFKWRHFQAEIILLCVRWYLRYPFSYRDLEAMMLERGLLVDHTTIYRWVQHYAPELEKRCRPYLKATNDSWRVDETYVKEKKRNGCISIAPSMHRETRWNFFSAPQKMRHSAKRFFAKALAAPHTSTPRVITVDTNASYPKAFKELLAEGIIPSPCELRQSKYLNNLVEQDHRFIKRLIKLGMGFLRVRDGLANRCRGYEAMNMRRSGQMRGVEKGNSKKQAAFIASLFGVAV